MANASAISHYGLFAAIQSNMFGYKAAGLIAYFCNAFSTHPLVLAYSHIYKTADIIDCNNKIYSLL